MQILLAAYLTNITIAFYDKLELRFTSNINKKSSLSQRFLIGVYEESGCDVTLAMKENKG